MQGISVASGRIGAALPVHAEKANYPIVLLCRVLYVARSSYYAWREATRHARQAADDALAHESRRCTPPPAALTVSRVPTPNCDVWGGG